ncbi:MAG: signal peptidase II [Kiritimatiellia bacterium]
MRRWLFLSVGLFFFVLVLDQGTKIGVERFFAWGESVEILPVFSLTYVRNQGAAWGMFQGAQYWLAGFGAVAVILCCVFWKKIFGAHRCLLPWGALLLSGIIGNLIDRLRLGYVVDFLDFYWKGYHFPCFNIADSAICVAVALLIFLQWRLEQK